MSNNAGNLCVRDASLAKTKVLPADASLTTVSDPIDLGPLTGISSRTALVELLATIPALALAKLPNTSVMTYTVEAAATTAFSSVTTLATLTQTGATGTATQPAQTKRIKIPSDCPRYVRIKAVADAAGADASAVSMKLELLA